MAKRSVVFLSCFLYLKFCSQWKRGCHKRERCVQKLSTRSVFWRMFSAFVMFGFGWPSDWWLHVHVSVNSRRGFLESESLHAGKQLLPREGPQKTRLGVEMVLCSLLRLMVWRSRQQFGFPVRSSFSRTCRRFRRDTMFYYTPICLFLSVKNVFPNRNDLIFLETDKPFIRFTVFFPDASFRKRPKTFHGNGLSPFVFAQWHLRWSWFQFWCVCTRKYFDCMGSPRGVLICNNKNSNAISSGSHWT